MGTSGDSDCQRASRSDLKDFTEDALTISAGNLFQNGTARMVKANWRRRVQHRCWWNLNAWPCSPFGLDRRRWTPWGIPRDYG